MHHTRLNIYSKIAIQRQRLERQRRLDKAAATHTSCSETDTTPSDKVQQAGVVNRGKGVEQEPDILDLSSIPKMSEHLVTDSNTLNIPKESETENEDDNTPKASENLNEDGITPKASEYLVEDENTPKASGHSVNDGNTTIASENLVKDSNVFNEAKASEHFVRDSSATDNSFYDLDLSLGSMATLTDQSLLGYVNELATELSFDRSMLDQSHVKEGSQLNTPVKVNYRSDAFNDPWLPTDSPAKCTTDSQVKELHVKGLGNERELPSYSCSEARYNKEKECQFQKLFAEYKENVKVLQNTHNLPGTEESTDESSDDIPTDDDYVSTSEFSDSVNSNIPLDVPVIKAPNKDDVTKRLSPKNIKSNPDFPSLKSTTDFSIKNMLSDVVTKSQSVNASIQTRSSSVMAPSKPESKSISSHSVGSALSHHQNSSLNTQPLQVSATFPPVPSPLMFQLLPFAIGSQPSVIPVTSRSTFAPPEAQPLLVPQNTAFSSLPMLQGVTATANTIFTSYNQFRGPMSTPGQCSSSEANPMTNVGTALNTRFPLPNINFSANNRQINPRSSIACKTGVNHSKVGIQQITPNFPFLPFNLARPRKRSSATKRNAQKGRNANQGKQHQPLMMQGGLNSFSYTQNSASIQHRYMFQEIPRAPRLPHHGMASHVPIPNHIQHLSVSNIAIQTQIPFVGNIPSDRSVSRFPLLPLNIGLQTFQPTIHGTSNNSGNVFNQVPHIPVGPLNIQAKSPLLESLLSTSNTTNSNINALSNSLYQQPIQSLFQQQSFDCTKNQAHQGMASTTVTLEPSSSASLSGNQTLNTSDQSQSIAGLSSEYEMRPKHTYRHDDYVDENSRSLESTEGNELSQNNNAIDLCSSALSSSSVDGMTDSERTRERLSKETESCFSSDSYDLGITKTTLENQSDQGSHTDSLDVCPDVTHRRNISQYLHQCSICSKGYCRKVDLDLHQLTHTFVLPKVENHVNIVNLLHKCEKCGFGFSRRSDYFEHKLKECSPNFEKENVVPESAKRKHAEEKEEKANSNSDDTVAQQPPLKRRRGRPRKYPEPEDKLPETDKATIDNVPDKGNEKLQKEVSKLKEYTEERRRGRPRVRKEAKLDGEVDNKQGVLQDNVSQSSVSQNSSEEDSMKSKEEVHSDTRERQSKKTAKVAISMNYERRNTRKDTSSQRMSRTSAGALNENEQSSDLNNNQSERIDKNEEKENHSRSLRFKRQSTSSNIDGSKCSDFKVSRLLRNKQKYGKPTGTLRTTKCGSRYIDLHKYRCHRKLTFKIWKVLLKRTMMGVSKRKSIRQPAHKSTSRECKNLSNPRNDINSRMLRTSPLHRYDLRKH